MHDFTAIEYKEHFTIQFFILFNWAPEKQNGKQDRWTALNKMVENFVIILL